MKQLPHKLRGARVFGILVPLIRKNQEVRADQLQPSVFCRLVDHDLGVGGVDHAAVYQGAIHKMEPHRPITVSAHTAELEGISLRLRLSHILKALGRFPDNFEEGILIPLLVLGQLDLLWVHVRVAILRQRVRRRDAHQNESGHHGI